MVVIICQIVQYNIFKKYLICSCCSISHYDIPQFIIAASYRSPVKGCISVVPNRIRHLTKRLIRCLSQKSNDCTRRQTDGRYIVNATTRGRSHEAYTTLKRITTYTSLLRCGFYPHDATFSAAIAVLFVCTLCLSARSRCSIETTGRIELVFGTKASLSYRIHCRFAVKIGYLQGKSTSLRNFLANSRPKRSPRHVDRRNVLST